MQQAKNDLLYVFRKWFESLGIVLKDGLTLRQTISVTSRSQSQRYYAMYELFVFYNVPFYQMNFLSRYIYIYNNRCTKFIAENVLAIFLSNVVFERYPLSLLNDMAKLFLCQRQHVIFVSYATNRTCNSSINWSGRSIDYRWLRCSAQL